MERLRSSAFGRLISGIVGRRLNQLREGAPKCNESIMHGPRQLRSIGEFANCFHDILVQANNCETARLTLARIIDLLMWALAKV